MWTETFQKWKRNEWNETEPKKRSKQTSERTCARGAKRPLVGVFTRRLFRYVSSVPFRFIRFVVVFEKFPSIYVILVI